MGEIKVLKFRDIQVAEDVAKKAMLGWFDVEFIMYGCAYLDAEKDKMYYKISSDEEDIYDFVEKSVKNQIYPGKVMSIRKRYPLPSGMKEFVAEEVKHELARMLKRTYPKEFFYELYRLAEESRENTAAELLIDMAEQLEGVFDEEKICYFEELVNYSYSCHELNTESYSQLCRWVEEERKNMEDDYSNKDIFKKTMYGLLYEKEGKVKYMADAQRCNIYRNICELEESGVFVGPIYSKTYWYNSKTQPSSIVMAFKNELKQFVEKNRMDIIRKIRKKQNREREEKFHKKVEEIRETYGNKPAETLMRYGTHWGIFQ